MLDVKYLWEIWGSFSLLWLIVGFRLHSQTWFLSEVHNHLVRHTVQKISVSFEERDLTIIRVNWPSIVSSSISRVQAEIQTSGLFTVCCSYYIVKWSCSVMSNPLWPWTVTYQAPLSMGFSRQEYWSGLPFPSPGDSSQPKDWTRVSHIVGTRFTIWATREVFRIYRVGPSICLMCRRAEKDPMQRSL